MKILFTDLDDTLLNKESKVSEYSKTVLRNFVNSGNILVPTSGRPLLSVQKCIRAAGIEDLVQYIIAYNGALIWNNKDNCEVWSSRLDSKTAYLIQKKCFEKGFHFQTYAHEQIFTPIDDDEIKAYTSKIFLPVVFTPDPVGSLGCDPYKALVINLTDHDKLCKLRDDLNPLIENNAKLFFSNKILLECVNKNTDKGTALLELCKLLNIDVCDSLSAGDQENDISMIKAAGTGIAVKNAIDTVKAAADIITEYDHNHDGIAKYLISLMP